MTDLSPESRALLDAARGADDPAPEDHLRVKRAVAAAIAAGAATALMTKGATAALEGSAAGGAATAGMAGSAATGVAAGTAASAGVAKVAGWVGIGALVGLASTGTFVAVSRTSDGTPTVPTSAPRAVDAPAGRVAPLARVVPAGGAPARAPLAEAPAAAEEPARALHRPDAAATRTPEPRAATSLAGETALLEAARAALGRGDAASALALLERHERAYPSGALVEERLASRVFALCQLGRRGDAARSALELQRRSPSSPLRAQVQGSCVADR